MINSPITIGAQTAKTASAMFRKQVALERGKRIKLARHLVNLTRKDMSEKYGINPNTIHAWEKGVNCLTNKNAQKLLDAFRKEGLNINIEWLLYEKGPTLKENTDLSNEDQSLIDISNLHGDLKILDEIRYFRNHYSNAISMMVVNDTLEPFFCYGDYVGGIYMPIERLRDLVGECCIVWTADEQILVAKIWSHQHNNSFIVGGLYELSNTNGNDFFSCDIRLAAQITRHWRLKNMVK